LTADVFVNKMATNNNKISHTLHQFSSNSSHADYDLV